MPDTVLQRPSRMACAGRARIRSMTPSRSTSMNPRLRACRESQVAVEPSGCCHWTLLTNGPRPPVCCTCASSGTVKLADARALSVIV